MTNQPQLQSGDIVVHPRRPEWGQGVVKEAARIHYQGAPAQRVAVQFANKGRVVINTAVAPLTPDSQSNIQASPDSSEARDNTMHNRPSSTATPQSHAGNSDKDAGWLNELEQSRHSGPAALAELPESMTDPFLSMRRRLEATLDAYRFSTSPRSLIDWAVAHTGLRDPLSQYTRHELEDAFQRFARERDQHLKALVQQLKRNGETQLLNDVLSETTQPDARAALSKHVR